MADLHGDYGGGERRSEECRKSGAHAGHDHDPPGFFLEMKALAHLVAKAAADLQRSAFAAYGSTHKVGEDRGAEDQGSHGPGDALISCDRQEDGIRSLAVVELLIEEDNDGRSYGHQENDPWMLRPQLCGIINAKRENACNRADDRTAQKAVAQEPDHLQKTCLDLEENRFQLVSEVITVEIHIMPPQC